MPFAVYVATIERARPRLEKLLKSADGLGLDIRPINGVDGKTIDEKDWVHINRLGFNLATGRTPLPGEYGCYASHLIAMETFLKDGGDFAIIVEDDVIFEEDTRQRFEEIISVAPNDALIKLTCHRRRGFHVKKTYPNGVTFGRYLCGPQGSSACYLISRSAAQKFLKTSGKMTLPFDRAIDNGWSNGLNILNIPQDIFKFGAPDTLVGTHSQYRATKFNRILRIPSYLNSAYGNVARVIYAYL